MPDIEDLAFKISAAYEDNYFVVEKKKIFDMLFKRYLPLADPLGSMEPYDALVELGYRFRPEFDELVKKLKEFRLIN
jgi:hypothetical protein